MILSEELNHGILSKVAPDEPIFVLRARDKNAPSIVREWVSLGMLTGVPIEKLEEARFFAKRMEDWARDNADGGKIPD